MELADDADLLAAIRDRRAASGVKGRVHDTRERRISSPKALQEQLNDALNVEEIILVGRLSIEAERLTRTRHGNRHGPAFVR